MNRPAVDSAALAAPDFDSAAYRSAFGRINGLVIVGEGLADRHFRRLAHLLPRDRAELLRLGAMEGRHAADFVGCGQNLSVRPDSALARRLLAPLHQLFQESDRAGDPVGCLVIQCVLIECFAVAAYRQYLPVADPYARTITATVLQDEAEHRSYGEQWLQSRFSEVADRAREWMLRSAPVALRLLLSLRADIEAIGIDPIALVAEFQCCFQESWEAIGYPPDPVRRLLARLAGATLAAAPPL